MKYVNVVIDNNTDATDLLYTYQTDVDDISIGQVISVPFGMHNRKSEAYVVEVLDERPEGLKTVKKILEINPNICLSEEAVNTALWMHTRYICRYVEAIKCFLPISEVKRAGKDPFENIEVIQDYPKDLNEEQKAALYEISEEIQQNKHDVFLLKGVTGSGKTEVYLQAMESVIQKGRQGIILVPEISLTPQVVGRFMNRFGKDSVAVLHSKLTPVQRTVQYKRIASGEVKLVIGARSAIFAPFDNIGLIVLDEEHETSYKSDKSPKYDTIELAIKRAMQCNAVVVLGSATPSVNDYYRSKQGIFKRIEIKNRYNQNSMPDVSIVDMTREIKAGNKSMFSKTMASEIQKQLDDNKQVILFLNRRGYNSFVSCRDCGYVVTCPDCGIAMPYHKDDGMCECHYCGRKVKMPKTCPECNSKLIGGYGVGTQQLEEKTQELFPGAVIDRLDLDSVKKKGELESTLKRFEKGKTNILIGTQIVAKGLDFANVGLVGIINADVSLNIPDFRSAERTFQLVTQAAGRSGRGDEIGKVIIQTYEPDHFALLYSARHDYEGFYEQEIQVRKAAGYPPFADLYQIIIQDENLEKLEEYSKNCAEWLRTQVPDGTLVLGPAAPMILKQGDLYRYQILIKTPSGTRSEISKLVRILKDKHDHIKNGAKLMTIDINPFSFV